MLIQFVNSSGVFYCQAITSEALKQNTPGVLLKLYENTLSNAVKKVVLIDLNTILYNLKYSLEMELKPLF